MNNKQKLHQIKLAQWATRFQEQASSGLTVKEWCRDNNFTIHTYNYWKHKLKLEYIDSMLPEQHDIVALTPDLLQSSNALQSQSPHASYSLPSCVSSDPLDLHGNSSFCISCGDIRISVGSSVSEEKLFMLIKAVRHA